MNIQIGSRAEALDERDRAGVGFATFDSRLLDQKCGNDAMDHLQHGPRAAAEGRLTGCAAESETRVPIDVPAPGG